ncbi:hypothetical protein A2U01_0070644, partial [Trifolium medium]|nr:hypothetical protein [Trifolium medium]
MKKTTVEGGVETAAGKEGRNRTTTAMEVGLVEPNQRTDRSDGGRASRHREASSHCVLTHKP